MHSSRKSLMRLRDGNHFVVSNTYYTKHDVATYHHKKRSPDLREVQPLSQLSNTQSPGSG
jgi:hypothetical protein